MCGIIGILGQAPVATSMVDALKRLEYRGYNSAGVATLEAGSLTRRRAEGKLRNLEVRLSKEPLSGTIGIGHTRWATHGRPNEINAHPHATDRRRGGPQRHHREFRRAARRARGPRRQVLDRDRHRGGRPSRHRRDGEGRRADHGRRHGAAAAQGRLRARLPVLRRGGPPDRGAQGLAARHRLRRRRDVSRLRRHRARAVHQRDQLPRGRRLRRAHPRRRRHPGRHRQGGDAAGDPLLGLGVPGRQGQPPPLHGEGDPRAAGGGRPHARPLRRLHHEPHQAAGQAAVRFQQPSTGSRSRPAAPPFTPG